MRITTAWLSVSLLLFLLLSGCTAFFPDAHRQPGTDEALRERIEHSRFAILTARGRFLLETRPYEKSLAEAGNGSFFAERRYRAFCSKVEETAAKLYEAGLEEFEEKNISRAKEALLISNRLSPDKEASKLLSKIWKQRAAEYEEARSIEAARSQQKWAGLEADFRKSMQAGNLARARKIAGEMEEIDQEKAASFTRHLDQRIEWEVQTQLSRGRMLYVQGYLREAVNVWQEALKLKPDDPELKQNISRAETFLENMDRWGDK